MGCGLQLEAVSSAGTIADFLSRGFVICLAMPRAAGALPRLAYYAAQPAIARWVFLPGREVSGQLCSSVFRQPAVFALVAPVN